MARKPDSLSHVEAAALALIGLTALVSIEDTLKLKSGETILIQGGAGGVAGFAVQVAKHIGARVITTASAANHDYLRKLGADQIIDYTHAGLHEDRVRLRRGVRHRRRRRGQSARSPCCGRAGAPRSSARAPRRPLRRAMTSSRCVPRSGRDRAHLERIVALVTGGAVRVPEIKVYPLSEAAAAHRVSEGRHLRGKARIQSALANAARTFYELSGRMKAEG